MRISGGCISTKKFLMFVQYVRKVILGGIPLKSVIFLRLHISLLLPIFHRFVNSGPMIFSSASFLNDE